MLTRPTALDTALPTQKDVLGQGIRFNPARWKRLLPDSAYWPPSLDECPIGN